MRHPRFTIEKLGGNELHYDLHLEYFYVVASWAVAGGPSTSPGERRTALRLEDSPLDEFDFRDDLGTDDLMVWDSGTYRCLEGPRSGDVPLPEALDRGLLWLLFRGEKIRGLYEMVQVGRDEDDEEWVLIRALEEALQPR